MADEAASAPALEDQTLGGFLAALASDRPAPGGGAAAAVALAMAHALVAMAVGVASRRPGPRGQAALAGLAASEGATAVATLDLARRDVEAFAPVVAAFALPRGTETERARRKEALAAGARLAVAEGERAAAEALLALTRSRQVVGQVAGSIAGDARAGAVLAAAALEIIVDNLAANAALLPAPEADGLRSRLARLRERALASDDRAESARGRA